jgi:predicted nucleic acid-binding protein
VPVLFDTDVLIWVFRGHPAAAQAVEDAAERHLSIVTYMELLQGARDRHDVKTMKNFLADLAFETLPLSEAIGHRAAIYMEEYALKVAMGVADALVAATAVEHHLTLCTANRKHYQPIQELNIKLFRP